MKNAKNPREGEFFSLYFVKRCSERTHGVGQEADGIRRIGSIFPHRLRRKLPRLSEQPARRTSRIKGRDAPRTDARKQTERTSPLPPLASAGEPVGLMATRSPSVMTERLFFRMTVTPRSAANAFASPTASASTSAHGFPTRRANSLGCGVKMTLHAFLSSTSVPYAASVLSASASSTSVPVYASRSCARWT